MENPNIISYEMIVRATEGESWLEQHTKAGNPKKISRFSVRQ